MTSRVFDFSYDQLRISFSDIELMLGYDPGHASSPIADNIREVMNEVDNHCTITGGYFIFDDPVMDNKNHTVSIGDSDLHVEKVVFEQVSHSTRIAVFCCSAGRKISDWSRQLIAENNLIKGYLVDVLGTLVVESAMMKMQVELIADMKAQKMRTTNRYSPGFCGWDVTERQRLSLLFPRDFCGVAVNENDELVPLKSLSGIIGIGRYVKYNSYECDECNLKSCIYRTHKLEDYMGHDGL
jgi:hypothetical protein